MVGRTLIERVEGHFTDQRECLKIPEWGKTPDEPLEIYSTPLTLYEKTKINRMSEGDDNEGTARAIILKATDCDGNKIFDLEDLPVLMRKADASILERIIFWISSGVDLSEPENFIEDEKKS